MSRSSKSLYLLEKYTKTCLEAVKKRRNGLPLNFGVSKGPPWKKFDYNRFYTSVNGRNCESVIGYVPIPVGVAGPVKINNKKYYVPLATTEGALVASINRGCSIISNIDAIITDDKMTRAPLLKFPDILHADKFRKYMDDPKTHQWISELVKGESNHASFKGIKSYMIGRNLYLRISCSTDQAMGMNILGKITTKLLYTLKQNGWTFTVVSLSGNMCTDKKSSAVNILEGRGKSVVAEALIDRSHLDKFKVTAEQLVLLNTKKNLLGSALAGSLGGFNAQAANVVTATFLATGQDCAQVVESSNCFTYLESDLGDLRISVSLPSLEIGTIGGGTELDAQSELRKLLKIETSRELACVIAGGVLCGELSLLTSLARNDLMDAHLRLNRK